MSKVHFKTLNVHELHSRRFEGLGLKNLSDGVNVIYGPNAAGKSVLARAASRVLSPDSLKKTDNITGRIEWNQKRADVDLRGKNDSVEWPRSVRADLYRLSVADSVEAPAEADRQKIQEAFSGGINLEKLAVQSPGRKPKKTIESALKQLAESQAKARALADDEARIPELEKAVRAARSAAEDADVLRKWLAVETLRKQEEDAADRLAKMRADNPGVEKQGNAVVPYIEETFKAFQNAREAYEEACVKLTGLGGKQASEALRCVDQDALADCESRYKELSVELKDKKQELAAAKQKAETAERRLAALHGQPAPGPLSATARQKLKTLVDATLTAKEEFETAKVRLEDARKHRRQKEEDFRNAGGQLDALPTAPVRADDLQAAIKLDALITDQRSAFNHAARAERQARDTWEQAKDLLPGVTAPPRQAFKQVQDSRLVPAVDAYREAALRQSAFQKTAEIFERQARDAEADTEGLGEAELALTDWLRHTSEPSHPSRPVPLVITALVFAGVAGLVGSLAGWLWATTVPVVGMIVLIILTARGRGTPAERSLRKQAADRVPQGWKPGKWTPDAVTAALTAVIQKRREMEAWRAVASESGHRAAAVDIETPCRELESCASVLRKITGINLPDNPGDYRLGHLMQNLQKWVDAKDSLDLAVQEHATNQAALEHVKAERRALIHDSIGAPESLETGASVKHWADRLESLLKATVDSEEKEEAAETARDRFETCGQQMDQFFSEFGWPYKTDIGMAKDQFLTWFEATAELDTTQRACGALAEQIRGLSEQVSAKESLMRQIVESYGFAYRSDCSLVGQLHTFRAWFDMTGRFDRAKEEARRTEKKLNATLAAHGVPSALEGHDLSLEERVSECERRARDVVPDYRDWGETRKDRQKQIESLSGDSHWDQVFARLELPDNPTVDEVAAKREERLNVASREDELKGQISGTKRLVKEAEKGNDLQGAQEAVNQAVKSMESWLREQQEFFAWQSVVDVIGRAVREESTPAIVQKANARLRSLTAGRYETITFEKNEIRVCDTREERWKTVAQLSTGTRIHLALALRLAVIEVSETADYAFPLLLDEVMASSDPEASRAIARAMKQIAGERQIFLFTNQPDDINVLRQELGDTMIVRAIGHSTVPAVQPPLSPPSLPSTPYTSGRIPLMAAVSQWPPELLTGLIPGLDPACRTVHAALAGLESDGRMTGQAIVAALEAAREKIAGTRRLLESKDLAGVEWITPAFRQRVFELLDRVNGHPETFLEGFRDLPRMRSENVDACEAWLETNGYLDDLPAIDALRRAARTRLPDDMANREAIVQDICGLFTNG